jgi:hypothetical protein
MEKQKIAEEVARVLRRPKIEDATWEELCIKLLARNQKTLAKILNDEYERRTRSR